VFDLSSFIHVQVDELCIRFENETLCTVEIDPQALVFPKGELT